MIVKKTWYSRKTVGFSGRSKYRYEGIFLLGILPIFIIRRSNI